MKGVLIHPNQDGDTRTEFDTADPASVEKAMAEFNRIVGLGHRGVALAPNGGHEHTALKGFDPNVETTFFIPQIIGG